MRGERAASDLFGRPLLQPFQFSLDDLADECRPAPTLWGELAFWRLGVFPALQFILDRFANEQGKPPIADQRFNAADRLG